MPRTGDDVASFLVTFNTLINMAGATDKRLQGMMVHVVLTSREVHSK